MTKTILVAIATTCLSLIRMHESSAQQTRATLSPREGLTGVVERHTQFASRHVEARNLDVWLPPDYNQSTKRFPVLYMHDGQNIFDPKTSYSGIDWGVDETMTGLIARKKIRSAIVVGIWNLPNRVGEYMPQKAWHHERVDSMPGMNRIVTGASAADNYLKFIVEELKPFIDSTYRTLPDRKNTFVMGSSMGGLISLYAMCEYPDVFGGAGCVSTHWPAGDGVVIDYLEKNLPDPKTHRFYFDFGTATLDSAYEPYQRKADAILKRAGWRKGKNWMTKKFEGEKHSERAWKKRVRIPLEFFLKR